MLADDDLARLRDRLTDLDYSTDRIVERIGTPEHEALARNNTTPAVRALEDCTDPLGVLTRLWPLQRPVPAAAVSAALPDLVDPLLAAGVLAADGDQLRALIDLRPYGSDDGGPDDPAVNAWIFSDLTPGLDGPMTPVADDFVLGVSPASITLAELTVRPQVGSALDLGTGCGVQSLHLTRHAGRVIGTDLNPRAVALARATMRLNELDVDLREGSLYQPVADEHFDLIVTNPPYVIAPPAEDGPGRSDQRGRLLYREAGLAGDELMHRVVVDGARRLRPGGTLQVLGNWAQPAGRDWQDRPAGWIAETGCDAHVVRREVLDAYAYIEIWLTDAGLLGEPGYRDAYRRWCDYFDRLGIESVGMGWLTLTAAGREQPRVTIEDWPHTVEQPIGPAWADRIAAVGTETALSDAELMSRRWRLAPDVVHETYGRPGAADPETIVLRQHRGFRRAIRATTELAAVVGACDGELPLGRIVAAVASILEVDADVLGAEISADIRGLVVDNLLTAVE